MKELKKLMLKILRQHYKKNLYDSYIRSFRFASDRIKDAGVIGFVSGNGFIEKSAMDGLRKCFKDEFSKIYIFNLRGDIRKNMLSKGRAKEGENVFRSGSMTGIAISILIKNPKSKEQGKIYYCDIGEDLKTEEKLEKIANFLSIKNIKEDNLWQEIVPDNHNDWINQRDNSFYEFLPMGDKKDKNSIAIFKNYSLGVATNRDAWCYNFSQEKLSQNMQNMINFYNEEVKRFKREKTKNKEIKIDDFVDKNDEKISWTDSLKNDLSKETFHLFSQDFINPSLYRAFSKQYLYFDKNFNQRQYQMPQIFPNNKVKNLAILTNGKGSRNGMSTLICDIIPDLNMLEAGAQCFPLYLYEKSQSQNEDKNTPELFASNPQKNKNSQEYKRTDAITNEALAIFTKQYQNQTSFKQFTKEDLFYYIYGLLHSKEYREKYGDNLSKELPRIPAVKNFADFLNFSKSGRKLAEIHLNYENQTKYPLKIEYLGKEIASLSEIPSQDLKVEKMKFAKNGKETDKTTIIYNNKITLKNIPLEAFDYIVNGKPAIDWVVERQCVSINKDSKIENNANDFANLTMKNPAYIIELLQSVISLSLKTVDIVDNLPKFEV